MKKLIFLVVNIFTLLIMCESISFASQYIWLPELSTGKWFIFNSNNEQIKNEVICDDIDADGIAYNYYVDENGYVLIDTICPDYHIVDMFGRRLDKYGEPETVILSQNSVEVTEEGGSGVIQELQQQFLANQDSYVPNDSDISVGALRQVQETPNFGPNLFIQETVATGPANSIIGKGVVFKEKAEDTFDATIDPEMKNYIVGGNSYSKSVNGTTFTKSKWKEVMALKGTGAYIDFENPNTNFNKLTGRIATHHFTYSDRETKCTLYVYDDQNEEIYSTSDFNYNSGKKFTFVFPRKSKTIRFELQVDGQYSTRVAYLRDMKFMFDKKGWEEEKEEDAENLVIESMAAEAANEVYYDEEEEARIAAMLDAESDVDEYGYTAAERALMASLSNANYYNDVDMDDEINLDPDNLQANEADSKAGPSFDNMLQEEAKRKANYGPGFVGITIGDSAAVTNPNKDQTGEEKEE